MLISTFGTDDLGEYPDCLDKYAEWTHGKTDAGSFVQSCEQSFIDCLIPTSFLIIYFYLKDRVEDEAAFNSDILYILTDLLRPYAETYRERKTYSYGSEEYYRLLLRFLLDQLKRGSEGIKIIKYYSYYDGFHFSEREPEENMLSSDEAISLISAIKEASDMKDSVQEGVKQLLKDGRFLVIFDGVDECPYGDKPRIYRAIEGFISDYFEGKPSNLCLISDRDVSTENQANMVSYVAASISKNDVAMYVNKFIENNPQEAFLNDDGKIDNTTKNDLIKKVVTLKTPEKISTVFELAQLTMIASASDEKYKELLDKSEDKRAVALNRYYLMALLEREAKEKLRAEGGDRKLSKTYRVHLVQAGLLREYQDMMDIERYTHGSIK